MKLNELQQGIVETGNKKYRAGLSTSPFWSLTIAPVRNPFDLFSFACHEYSGTGYSVFMYKTSYYTHPVISRTFDKDAIVEEVITWIDETLTKIKEGL